MAQQAHKKKVHRQDPVHQVHRAKKNMYGSMIEQVKRAHWEGFLETLDDRAVWTAHRYMSGELTDRGKARVPMLKVKQVDRIPRA